MSKPHDGNDAPPHDPPAGRTQERAAARGAVTLADVAARAGVNPVTVSVVLNNARANTRVSVATRERIRAAAAELRYQPNDVARSLRRKRTGIIGLHIGYGAIDASNPFLSQIVSGLQQGCEEFRQDLLLHGIFHGSTADEAYAVLANGKIDGLVLFAPPDDAVIPVLADSHLPVVAVAEEIPTLPSVLIDHEQGGRMQAEHLARGGHRRVLYQMPKHPVAAADRRAAAFRDVAAERGMEVLEVRSCDYAGSLSEEALHLLSCSKPSRPTAVACWEDLCAYRVLATALDLGLSVPEELAIIGFDGITPFTEPVWRMTTVCAPWREVARTAVSLLVSRIHGRQVPGATVFPVSLRQGNTG